MSNATQDLTKIYKDLVEKELKDICDEVLKEGIFHYILNDYIYVEHFINAGHKYISDHNLPIEPEFINNYLSNKIKERELLDINTKKLSKKYIAFYNNHLFDKASSYVKKNNKERTVIINCLRSFLNFLTIRMPSVFVEFEKLKLLLNELGISPANQLIIFIDAVETNYTCFSQEEFYVYKPDYEEMLKHKFKYISKEEMTDIVKNNKIEGFLNDNNPKKEKAQNELRDYLKNNCVDVTDFQKVCVLLVQTMHKEVRTEEDNQTIKECMEKLCFAELTYRLLRYLDRQNELSNAKTSSQVESIKEDTKSQEEKRDLKEENIFDDQKKQEKEIPKKQTNLNQTIREINKYFDLDTYTIKEELSLDQIIYILSLMYLVNIEDDKIEVFLRSSMRIFKDLHPYVTYYQAYDKFAYLSENNPEVKEHLDMIEYILSDANIFICDDETYASTKELVIEELKEIIRLTNGDYSYEIDEAKKLLNTNKE